MIRVIKQDIDDIVTYEFDIENLGAVTVTGVAVKSVTGVVIDTVTQTDTTAVITVNSTASVLNSFPVVVLAITMSNGDVEHRTIYFRIVPIPIC